MSDDCWRAHAACIGVDLNVFFPIGDYITTAAEQLCRNCTVQDACLDYALQAGPELQGIWAGTTQQQRRNLRRRRRAHAHRKAAAS